MGFIDHEGDEIIPFVFDLVWDFKDGNAKVRKDNRKCYINKSGKSIIMNKTEIFDKLRLLHKSLREPGNIDFASKDGILTITMTEKGLIANMQNNESAFEGWAIAIKSLLPEMAKKVIISWEANTISESNTHYTRFLYRVAKFIDSYNWAVTEFNDERAAKDYNRLNRELEKWVTNFPSKAAEENAVHEEARLERQLNQILPGYHDHQLPVGLFFDEVSSKPENERTPRNGSQIDLWSIEDDTFTVYELKKEDNRKVGIVSELMFYVNVIKDLIEGKISFGKGAEFVTERNYHKVFENIHENRIKNVIGVFLTNDLHPILNLKKKNLFEILNNNSRGIVYKQLGFVITKLLEISE